MNTLNVLYTINSNYFNYFLVSLISLLENNQDKNFINIYLIQEDLKLDQIETLMKLKK